MTSYILPLQSVPQTFSVDMGGITYTMTLYWNDLPDAGWCMDLADAEANSIFAGLPLVTGINLLSGLNYLNIGNGCQLYVFGEVDLYAVPTLTNLGQDANLYLVTTP